MIAPPYCISPDHYCIRKNADIILDDRHTGLSSTAFRADCYPLKYSYIPTQTYIAINNDPVWMSHAQGMLQKGQLQMEQN